MQIAVRPFTTGVALVGASVIAISPIAVKPSEIEISALRASTAAVELMASPIDFYTQVIQRTVGNVGDLAQIFLESPAPILQQIIANQAANLQELIDALMLAGEGISTALTEEIPPLLQSAFNDLTSGNVEGALNTLLSVPLTFALPLLNVLGAVITPITEAAANFNRVVQDVLAASILGGALAVAGPIISTIGSVGTAIQGVIDAVAAGDPIDIVNAVINAPGVFADAFLNGGYGPLFLGVLPAPGFLTAEGLLGPLGAGPIGFLLAIRQAIADAIAPPAPPAPLREASTPEVVGTTDEITSTASTAALTVSLDVPAASTDDTSTAVATATDPEPEVTPVAEAEDEAETVDEVTEETEEGADGTEEGVEDESDAGDGATDLSDGNKVEPGDTVGDDSSSDEGGGDGSGDEATDPADENTAGADAGADGGSDAGSDSGDSGDSGGGDGGTE